MSRGRRTCPAPGDGFDLGNPTLVSSADTQGEAMFTKIAWATDGSESALQALSLAERLARDTGGRLTIIHVQEIKISLAGVLMEDNEPVMVALRSIVQQLRDSGIDAVLLSAKASTRDIPRTLLGLAETVGTDVIVVGNRGHGSLSDFMAGSVSAGLRRIASLPIIVAPSGPAVAARLDPATVAA
jgi:nucleotide-binding universal stress UspA family protein